MKRLHVGEGLFFYILLYRKKVIGKEYGQWHGDGREEGGGHDDLRSQLRMIFHFKGDEGRVYRGRYAIANDDSLGRDRMHR